MVETAITFASMAAPYVLIGVGIVGLYLLIVRVTAKVAAPVMRG